MRATPYHDVPRGRFLVRMLGPSILVFLFFFFAVGVVAASAGFHKLDAPAQVVPFWEASFHHYKALLFKLSEMSQNCLLRTPANELDHIQCGEWWLDFLKLGPLAGAPVIAVLLFFFLALGRFTRTYQRAQEKLSGGGEAGQLGVVTHPAEAPMDLYSWFYGLRPVVVELKNKKKEQVKVYVTADSKPPVPGEKVIFFKVGKEFGEQRRLAMLYAPSVAVLRGE